MIAYLAGKVLGLQDRGFILGVNGVGYDVQTPRSLRTGVKEGEDLAVWVYSRVREDAFELFGFATQAARTYFELLLSLKQVGPRVALEIMEVLSPAALTAAVRSRNAQPLLSISGIGKRSAERILLDLEAKLEKMALIEAHPLDYGLRDDLQSALLNLGYKEKVIRPLLEDLLPSEAELPVLLRSALARLRNDNNSRAL